MNEVPCRRPELLGHVALALASRTEAPHCDRLALRARRIYRTLAPLDRTANQFPTQQYQAQCALMPDALSSVPNRSHARSWTEVDLVTINVVDLALVRRLAGIIGGGREPSRITASRSVQKEKCS